MTFAQQVGRNIRRIRRAADVTQEDLAFRAGIHRTAISLYESGRQAPRLESFVRIAGALGIGPDDLLAGVAWAPGDHGPGRLVFGEEGS